jgi:hypothetical protein
LACSGDNLNRSDALALAWVRQVPNEGAITMALSPGAKPWTNGPTSRTWAKPSFPGMVRGGRESRDLVKVGFEG